MAALSSAEATHPANTDAARRSRGLADALMRRGGTRTLLTSTATELRLHAQLDAYEGGERVAPTSWTSDVLRDLI